jgi:hypothetical protein
METIRARSTSRTEATNGNVDLMESDGSCEANIIGQIPDIGFQNGGAPMVPNLPSKVMSETVRPTMFWLELAIEILDVDRFWRERAHGAFDCKPLL